MLNTAAGILLPSNSRVSVQMVRSIEFWAAHLFCCAERGRGSAVGRCVKAFAGGAVLRWLSPRRRGPLMPSTTAAREPSHAGGTRAIDEGIPN